MHDSAGTSPYVAKAMESSSTAAVGDVRERYAQKRKAGDGDSLAGSVSEALHDATAGRKRSNDREDARFAFEQEQTRKQQEHEHARELQEKEKHDRERALHAVQLEAAKMQLLEENVRRHEELSKSLDIYAQRLHKRIKVLLDTELDDAEDM